MIHPPSLISRIAALLASVALTLMLLNAVALLMLPADGAVTSARAAQLAAATRNLADQPARAGRADDADAPIEVYCRRVCRM